MPENKLAEILKSVAERMRADFNASTSVMHRGEAGATRESIVCDFVADYAPGHVQVIRSGEIVTTTGETSPQCDVIILDRSTPPLRDMGNYRIVPSECVYGVIEVKTTLDKAQLTDACEKIRKIKSLPKTAYFPDPLRRNWTMHGRSHPYVPTFGMIFAFGSIGLDTLGEHFMTWCVKHKPEECPNSIWVLGQGWLQWTNPGGQGAEIWPTENSRLSVLRPAWLEEDILLPLTLQVSSHLTGAWMPPFRLLDYAGHDVLGVLTRNFWRADTGSASP